MIVLMSLTPADLCLTIAVESRSSELSDRLGSLRRVMVSVEGNGDAEMGLSFELINGKLTKLDLMPNQSLPLHCVVPQQQYSAGSESSLCSQNQTQ